MRNWIDRPKRIYLMLETDIEAQLAVVLIQRECNEGMVMLCTSQNLGPIKSMLSTKSPGRCNLPTQY